MAGDPRQVFLTGGTGYMGSRLARILLDRGHYVKALTRITPNLGRSLPMGCHPVFGNALTEDYLSHVAPSDTFVHLVGVSHPSPAKAAEFRSIDLKGLQAAVRVAQAAHIRHFVYVSVAHPAPMMKAYIAVREECEQIIRESGLNATILRPWYVLGPGHRWPYVLLPMYWIMERFPNTRESALRVGLVTLQQMLNALVNSVENPCEGVKILEAPQIREQSIGDNQAGSALNASKL
ncbi:MAG: epimerase [Candidatus Angelobacter sp. Gp1-AA117]|nr:MAG: epimerase [Candidatus Angelobacter sp. Gp1-AA117]